MSDPILARNITAVTEQLTYQARGNPPGAHPRSAVGNFFPGLEFNFLNVWKRIFVGLELLESSGEVINVDPGSGPELQALRGMYLWYVEAKVENGQVVDPGTPTFKNARGPTTNADGSKGPVQDLTDDAGNPIWVFLEWGNLLARLHATYGGRPDLVWCIFRDFGDPPRFQVNALQVRRLMESDSALISKDANKPGELTESLCSPWQTDYIGCACYYWAANRPDYINTWDKPDGSHGGGHNWLNEGREMQPDPSSAAPKPFYTLEPGKVLEHEDIMQDWEKKLRFVIGGKDETP